MGIGLSRISSAFPCSASNDWNDVSANTVSHSIRLGGGWETGCRQEGWKRGRSVTQPIGLLQGQREGNTKDEFSGSFGWAGGWQDSNVGRNQGRDRGLLGDFRWARQPHEDTPSEWQEEQQQNRGEFRGRSRVSAAVGRL